MASPELYLTCKGTENIQRAIYTLRGEGMKLPFKHSNGEILIVATNACVGEGLHMHPIAKCILQCCNNHTLPFEPLACPLLIETIRPKCLLLQKPTHPPHCIVPCIFPNNVNTHSLVNQSK